MLKADKIRFAIRATKERRRNQSCRVFKVKIDYSKLSAKQKEQLKMMFVETKWLYNYIISQDNIFDINPLHIKEVKHYDKDKNEIFSAFKYLGSQMKQSIANTIKSNLKMFATKKRQGQTNGKLKFLSEYKSINLQQYRTTYSIVGKNKIKIQRITGAVKVNGLDQLSKIGVLEIANAKLLNTASGYYLAITTYSTKEKLIANKTKLGIDLGCKTTVTCSNGVTFDCKVEETERLKRLQHRLQAKKKGSNSYRKIQLKLRKEHEHISNIRTDKANKIVAYLKQYIEFVWMER